ncbi:MAG: hypothetical protein OXH69_23550, partial [Acidobacteria bacterium]|nr:hypothetical protein [Acidobacteriota bacterium]
MRARFGDSTGRVVGLRRPRGVDMRARTWLRLRFVVLLAALSLGSAGSVATGVAGSVAGTVAGGVAGTERDAPVAQAAEERDGARLRALVAQGADVNAPAPDG